MAKGSAKELFRQMKNELRYGGDEQNCLEVVSCDMSSEYEDFKTYHNEIKYLKKEQLKAYICKLRKEIKNYKNREINYIIEIKYLRRKIIRLQNVIENDKVLKRDEQNFFLNNEKRGYSLKNYNNNLNLGLDENLIFTANNFNHNNRQNSINKSEKKYRSGTSLTYNNNANNANNYINSYNNNCNSNSSVCRRSYGGKSCFKSDSIRSINQDIHKGRRIVSAKDLCFDNKRGEEYEKYSGLSRGIGGTKELLAKNEKKNGSKKIIHTIKPIEKVYSCGKPFDFNKKTLNNKNYENSSDKYRTDRREHSLYNLNLYKNTKNICSEKGEKKDIFISNRSYSSASKFELKRHLISNNKNINRMSSHINSIIEKDINKYYNSKESILNQRSGKTNNIKVNKNAFDIYNDAYHKKILSKKYSSPYAYQNSAKNSSNKKNDIIRRNIKNVETKSSNQVVGSDYIDMKGDIKKGTRTNLIKKDDSDNVKLEDDCNSSSPINKIKQYFQSEKKKKKKKKSEKKTEKKYEKKVTKKKASKIIENEKEDEKEKEEKRKNDNWGTTLKWKGRQSNEKSEGSFNQIAEKETNSIEDNNTNLSNLKKVIQSDLKENFKQELEKLKKRNNILISKPHVYCGIPFDSTSGGSEKDNYNNSNNNTKKNSENKNKISVNYLKGPSISNASFNDIEKRISNLQNYLKKNKK